MLATMEWDFTAFKFCEVSELQWQTFSGSKQAKHRPLYCSVFKKGQSQGKVMLYGKCRGLNVISIARTEMKKLTSTTKSTENI